MKYLIDNINSNSFDIDSFYNQIKKDKRDRISKYVKEDDKLRSIYGEYLLNKLLKEVNVNYKDIEYYYNQNEKPYIKNNNIYFNISHSYDYVISVISQKEVGIDIEKIRKVNMNTSFKYITKEEKEYILKSSNYQYVRYFKIYTLKEAYIKMKGLALQNIMDVNFIIKDNKIICSDKNVKIGFINKVDGYIIAYCEEL